ncbi:Uu.00g112130.m01.CDS01 [Anthostomella pinea]|uniref:Uu.00g112130.m01.CDS01 n=1 Tax=Anthostomella pinea TaxID=933095 RepID=A0AAI8VG67_9PEZI|nr:Uu.00g112130.m01.CDS01 [Anthostomella pinea]
MGAVVSCIQSMFRTIGSVLMAIVNGIGSILTAIINGIVAFFDILITFLTCGYCGKKRRAGRSHGATTSRV